MQIQGWTYISVGDPFNPDYKEYLGKNDSVPLGENKVIAAFASGVSTVHYKYLETFQGVFHLLNIRRVELRI